MSGVQPRGLGAASNDDDGVLDVAWALPGAASPLVACDTSAKSKVDAHDSTLLPLRYDQVPHPTLNVNSYSFHKFRGMSEETFLHPTTELSQDKEFQALTKVIKLTQGTWQEMREKNFDVENDTIESLLEQHTRTSTITIVVEPKDPHNPEYGGALTCARIFTDRKDIRDAASLPSEIRDCVQVTRGDRMFSNQLSRDYFGGDAMDLLFDEMFRVAKGPIATKVVIQPKEQADAYRRSYEALRRRYFVPTGETVPLDVHLPDGTPQTIIFEWLIYPPPNAEKLQEAKAFRRVLDEQAIASERNIIPCLPFIDPEGKEVVHVTSRPTRDSTALADYFPEDRFIELSVGDPAGREHHGGYRSNLQRAHSGNGVGQLQPESLDVIVNSKVLAQLAKSGPHSDPRKNIEEAVSKEVLALRIGGKLVFYDEAYPEDAAYAGVTRSELQRMLRNLGLRDLQPQQFEFQSKDQMAQGVPEMIVAAEKVSHTEGAVLCEASSESKEVAVPQSGYVKFSCYRNKNTGEILEVAERKDQVLGVDAYFEHNGRYYLVEKLGYPRPIIGQYVTEQIAAVADFKAMLGDVPIGQVAEQELRRLIAAKAAEILRQRAGIEGGRFDSSTILRYYPSPKRINEVVTSVLVEIPSGAHLHRVEQNYSGLSTSGWVAPIETRQILKCSQRDALPSNRSEIAARKLHLDLGIPLGHWVGDEITLRDQSIGAIGIHSAHELYQQSGSGVFESADVELRPGHMDLRVGEFEEKTAGGKVLPDRSSLEYVTSSAKTGWSDHIVPVLLVVKSGGEVLGALEIPHHPVAQIHNGDSALPGVPTYTIPLEDLHPLKKEAFLRNSVREHYGVKISRFFTLGGRYWTSSGITREEAQPMIAEIDAASLEHLKDLHLTPLNRELLKAVFGGACANTMTVVGRAVHALGIER